MLSRMVILAFLSPYAGVVIYVLFSMLKSIAALSWPSVTGKILSLEKSLGSSISDDGSEVEVKYIYVVNAKEYFSKNLAFGYLGQIDFLTKRLHKKLKEKIYVPVYYNPKNPEQAVLLKGVQNFHIIFLIVHGSFLSFIVYVQFFE
jgi:hypothetical protein